MIIWDQFWLIYGYYMMQLMSIVSVAKEVLFLAKMIQFDVPDNSCHKTVFMDCDFRNYKRIWLEIEIAISLLPYYRPTIFIMSFCTSVYLSSFPPRTYITRWSNALNFPLLFWFRLQSCSSKHCLTAIADIFFPIMITASNYKDHCDYITN